MEKLEIFFQKKKQQEKPKQALEEGNNNNNITATGQPQQAGSKLVLRSDNSGENKLQIQNIISPPINVIVTSPDPKRSVSQSKEGIKNVGKEIDSQIGQQQQNEKNNRSEQNMQIIQNESIMGYISENIAHRKNNQWNQEEVKKLNQFTRFLLKDVDKLKLVIGNIESATKGVEYLRRKIKSDKMFHQKLKQKVSILRDLI